MSHELTVRDKNALDVQPLQSDIEALSYNRILPDRSTELEVRTGFDGEDDTFGRYHYADPEPKADIVADIEALLPNTSTVEYRHTWDEYDDVKTNNASYYPSQWTEGLRTPPTVTQDGQTIDVSVDYLDEGTELSGSLTQTFDASTSGYAQVHTVYANGGGVYITARDVNNNPQKSDSTWGKPEFDGVEVATVYMKEHIDRIPNGGIETANFQQ